MQNEERKGLLQRIRIQILDLEPGMEVPEISARGKRRGLKKRTARTFYRLHQKLKRSWEEDPQRFALSLSAILESME